LSPSKASKPAATKNPEDAQKTNTAEWRRVSRWVRMTSKGLHGCIA
jgi:hypothetical protein